MIDLVIIGGGPAGLTAGLYAARAGLRTTLLESWFPGGQAAMTDRIANYPGFPDGVTGAELMDNFLRQAKSAGMTLYEGGADALEADGEIRRARVGDQWIEARAMILAMGAEPKTLGVPGEAERIGRGISYCATCDGALYAGKPVAVIGGGNTAVEDVLYLSRMCSVTWIHRRDTLRAVGERAETALRQENVTFHPNTRVTEIQDGEKGMRLVLDTGAALDVAACFVAVGTRPRTELAHGLVTLDAEGYVVAGEDTRTSLSRVYAAGDLRIKPLRQVATAVGDGAVAATMAQMDL